MSLQPMVLFDAITTRNAFVAHMGLREGGFEPLANHEIKKFIEAKRVWVDETLHQKIDFTATTVDFRRDFGELRLPFPSMWLEWNASIGMDGLHTGAQCFAIPGRAPGENSYLMVPWIIDSALKGFQNIPVEHDCILRVDLDGKTGEVLGVSGLRRVGDDIVALPDNKNAASAEGMDENCTLALLVRQLWNAFVAIGFMNCRNVTTERHERAQRLRRKQRRQRPPKVDYHTIVLPGRGSWQVSSGSGEAKGLIAAHQVRGHFKTFTPERPLMGKHTGTYWWGWQVRGNVQKGVVVSDYKLATH